MYERITIDESRWSAGVSVHEQYVFLLNSPINQSNDALKATERDGGGYVPLLSLLLLSYATCLAHHVDESHNQWSEADTAKGVCQSSPCRSSCGPTWHSTWLPSTEEPAAIDSRNDGMDCIFEPKKSREISKLSSRRKIEGWDKCPSGASQNALKLSIEGLKDWISLTTPWSNTLRIWESVMLNWCRLFSEKTHTGEGYEDDQANHLSWWATTCTAPRTTSRIGPSSWGFIFYIHFSVSAFVSKDGDQSGKYLLVVKWTRCLRSVPLQWNSPSDLPETKVRENQAPKATEAIPPIALTRKTWPKDLATSIVCWSMTTLKGIRGIHVTKHTYGDIGVSNSFSRQSLGACQEHSPPRAILGSPKVVVWCRKNRMQNVRTMLKIPKIAKTTAAE